MTSPHLHSHVALVTGGSRGIGAAVARSLAGAGAAVVINYRERSDAAQSLAAAIEKEGGRAIAIGAGQNRRQRLGDGHQCHDVSPRSVCRVWQPDRVCF